MCHCIEINNDENMIYLGSKKVKLPVSAFILSTYK